MTARLTHRSAASSAAASSAASSSDPQRPRALPRRAGRIRALAADMALIKLRELSARQAVSDRIGYAVASIVGAAAFHRFGTTGLEGLVGLYALTAAVAFRRLKNAKRRPGRA